MTEREIFIAAAQIESPSERGAFVDRACGGDIVLRERINGLLAEQDKLGSFLEVPPGAILPSPSGRGPGGEGAATVEHEPPSHENAGMNIGPYKLLQKLGEGGMGTVWVAEQERPVKRRVALKVIKPGMDSAQVIARFEAERQALAMMDHSNIAKVLDAGTTDAGRPYFVMELVKGVPITKYCDELNLPIRERLALFVPVCQAIQHAHQKGIIHRDLKPSNILVAMQDGRPVPKVIDFGVAKALHQPLTEHTMMTEFGAVIGTLEYMSPEQAELSALDIDTRADIYALGVLLYELLTGTTPFDRKLLRSAALDEMLRVIREVEPPKPSTRLTGSENLASLAAHRRTEPRKLGAEVRGELDWIVMKALEKDRTRRYESASSFARDIECFLTDEPVAACSPSAAYRLKKLLRRHKGPMMAAAIILLSLFGGIVGTTWGLIRAEKSRKLAEAARTSESARAESEAQQRRRAEAAEATALANERQAAAERDRAEQEKRVAQAVTDFLQNRLLGQADPEVQTESLLKAGRSASELKPNPTIRELLDRAAAELTPEKIETQFPKLPLVQAEILRTIGHTYMHLGEVDFAPGIEHLERSRDLFVRHLGADQSETMVTLGQLGTAYMRGRRLREATQIFEQLRDRQTAILGPDHADTLTTLHNLAWTYRDDRRYQDSIRLFEQVRDKRMALLGKDHLDTINTVANLALAYSQGGRPKDSIPLFEEARDKRVALLGADHPQTLWTLWGLAGALDRLGNRTQAIDLFEKILETASATLGSDYLLTRYVTTHLAALYTDAGRSADAILLLEKSRARNTATFGPDHIATLSSLYSLGLAYQRALRYSEAAPIFEQVREQRAAKLGPNHEDTLEAATALGWCYYYMRRTPESIELFEQVCSALTASMGSNHSSLLSSLNGLGNAHSATRQFPKAVERRKQYVAVVRHHYAATDSRLIFGLEQLGGSLIRNKEFAEAESTLKECLLLSEQVLPNSYAQFRVKSLLGAAMLGQKHYEAAETLLISGYKGLKQHEVTISANLRRTLFSEALQRLIDLYTAWDKPEEAEKWRETKANVR